MSAILLDISIKEGVTITAKFKYSNLSYCQGTVKKNLLRF